MEWAIEHVKTYGKPVAATICIGPSGDEDGVSLGECAVRMARAGADLVGLNCLFDPFIMLDCLKVMKQALDDQGLKPYLMSQPLGKNLQIVVKEKVTLTLISLINVALR